MAIQTAVRNEVARRLLARLSLTALATVLTPVSSIAQAIPDRLPSRFDPQNSPSWVAAKGVSEGKANLEDSEARKGVICSETPSGHGNDEPRRTLADLVEHADAILLAEVVAQQPGFFFGHPTRLSTLKPLEVLKDSNDFALEAPFLSLPGVMFRVDGTTYCSSRGGPLSPTPGSRVLLFPYEPPRDLDGRVIEVFDTNFVVEDVSGKIQLPNQLETDPSVTKEGNLSQVVEVAREILHSQTPREL